MDSLANHLLQTNLWRSSTDTGTGFLIHISSYPSLLSKTSFLSKVRGTFKYVKLICSTMDIDLFTYVFGIPSVPFIQFVLISL